MVVHCFRERTAFLSLSRTKNRLSFRYDSTSQLKGHFNNSGDSSSPHVPTTREGLWGKANTGRTTTGGQARIAENSMIHAMKGQNGDPAMIADIGRIAGLPELALSPAAIFLRETPMTILKNNAFSRPKLAVTI